MKSHGVILTPLESAELSDLPVPGRVLIVPWGTVESSNGTFVVDEESARLAMAAFADHGTDVPIDYEHQTLGGEFASPNGQAPAAGWIKRLEAEAGSGIFAVVEWTEPAAKQIAARQYRYLSPVAVIRGSDRKLTSLHSAELTNKPAIVGAMPLVNKAVPVVAGDDVIEGLRGQLQASDAYTDTELLVAAAQQIRDLEGQIARREADELIAAARRSGRLNRSQEAWARRLVACNRALFEEWLSTAPVPVATGRMVDAAPAAVESERSRTVLNKARQEFRSHPQLAKLTSEEAYVSLALREVKS